MDAGGVVFGVCLGCSWGLFRSCNSLCFSSSASSLVAKPENWMSPEIECLLLCFYLANTNCNMDSLNGHITLLGLLPLFSLSFPSPKHRHVGMLYFHSSCASSWTTSGSLDCFPSHNAGLTAHLSILEGPMSLRSHWVFMHLTFIMSPYPCAGPNALKEISWQKT